MLNMQKRILITGANGFIGSNIISELMANNTPITAMVREKSSIDYGVFAMENAQGGVVIESVEALANHRCKIIEMFQIPIEQNLLGIKGINIGDITQIHSHQQALRQCKNYLSDNFWTRPLIEEDDTAEAARRLSEKKLPETAAVIANRSCAKLYKLEILQESIHDLKHNLTLFIGITKYVEK